MAFSPTDSKIFSPLFSDETVSQIFSDEAYIAYLIQVEVALAKVQAELGIIPTHAAQVIAECGSSLPVDFPKLAAATEKAGVPITGLLAQYRTHIKKTDVEAATYLHWGATTQDILDTALVLQIRDSLKSIEEKLKEAIQNFATLADQHRTTVMAGRTHSQQALAMPFGLKVAGWIAPLLRHLERLKELKPRLLVVQFGGAVGTLSPLKEQGYATQQALANELSLSSLTMPWHTQRDGLVESANWLSLVTGSLGKMGQDIILMAQSEVGELRESADTTRGGSSTMPQKSNPVISEILIATARKNASLVATLHNAMIHEHERATHSWQLEWLSLPEMFSLTAAAVNKAHFLSRELVVNAEKMAENIAKSNGLMLAESVNFALAEYMDKTDAKALITEAVHDVIAQDKHLIDSLKDKTSLEIDWDALRDERQTFGSADVFIDNVLAHAHKVLS